MARLAVPDTATPYAPLPLTTMGADAPPANDTLDVPVTLIPSLPLPVTWTPASMVSRLAVCPEFSTSTPSAAKLVIATLDRTDDEASTATPLVAMPLWPSIVRGWVASPLIPHAAPAKTKPVV